VTKLGLALVAQLVGPKPKARAILRWSAFRCFVPGQAIAVLLFALPATAQPGEHVVNAEAPIVNGNAVVAKQRALADAFRQAVEGAFSDLLKESGGEAQPLAAGLVQLKASFANRGQRFVRSYRILEEEESNGRLRLQIDADVDTALVRREMERVRGTTAGEPVSATPLAGPSILVGGDMPDEARATMVKALAAAGVQAQSAALRDEAPLVAAAARQTAHALWLAATSFGEGSIRGASRVSVRCELRARLLPAGPGTRAASLESSERGFAGDEAAARLACWQRAAGALARQASTFLQPTPAGARYVTLDLDVVEPAALMTLIQLVKRLGAVNAAEVRHVTTRQAEIRVFTRMSGREIETALIRDVAGRLLVTEVKPPADRVTLQVRLAQAGDPPPGAGAEPPATKP
jgi:hypothetical protein